MKSLKRYLPITLLLTVFLALGLTQIASSKAQAQALADAEALDSAANSVSQTLSAYVPASEILFGYCEDGWGSEKACDQLADDLVVATIEPKILKVTFSALSEKGEAEESLRLYGEQQEERIQNSRDTLIQEIEEETTTAYEKASESLQEAISTGEEVLSASDGKVVSEEPRVDLSEKITLGENSLTKSTNSVSLRLAVLNEVEEIEEQIEEAITNTQNSMNEWEAEQEEARRQEEAARLEREEQLYAISWDNSGGQSPTATSSENGAEPQVHYVSSSSCSDPFAAEQCLDGQGIKTIDFTPWGGPIWIGGHRYGAAGDFASYQVGDTVIVSGAGAGTYQITNISLLSKETGIQANSLGGGYAFQTCTSDHRRVLHAIKVA